MRTAAPGRLEVETVIDRTGRTRVASLTQSYPQRVTAPLYVDSNPQAAYLCVQSPSGGVFSDDQLRTAVTTRTGSHLLLTSQSATQVFDGPGAGASHSQVFDVHAGSVLEYLPRTVIPHAQASYAQSMEVNVIGDGVFVGWDSIAAGRLGHGERYRYRSVQTRMSVAIDGQVEMREAIRLSDQSLSDRADLIGANYFATLVVIAPHRDLSEVLSDYCSVIETSGCRGGASMLPASCGLIVRLISDRAPPLRKLMSSLVGLHRRHLLSMDPPPSRIL